MIHHVALWASDLERLKDFYVKYFNGTANEMYHNNNTGFKSYFITFGDGAKLEIMQIPSINEKKNSFETQYLGLIHIAFSVGSREAVDTLTERILDDGFILASSPRTTGDGYYESCVFDPELNRIEITI